MALTIHQEAGKGREQRWGNETVIDVQVDCDTSYPASGYPLDYAQLKPHVLNIHFVEMPALVGGGTYIPRYDYALRTLRLYTAPGAEVTTNADVSAIAGMRMRFHGTP